MDPVTGPRPSLWAIYISFTDLALAGPKALDYSFTGLKNYIKLFSDKNFHHSLSLSLQYTLYTNIGQFSLGLIAALIAVVIIAAITLVGTDLENMFNNVSNSL